MPPGAAPAKLWKKNTFNKSYVIKYLNDNFISIRVDIDKENGIAKKLRVRGVPTSLFLKKNGDVIASQPGYIPPDSFEKILAFINTDNYKNMDFGKFSKTYKRNQWFFMQRWGLLIKPLYKSDENREKNITA